MRILMLTVSVLLLAACASAPATGIGAAMHPENGQQVGWQQVTTGDGDPLFVVRSAGATSYSSLLKVAEAQADKLCVNGYRVLDVEGNDQPQVETYSQKYVLASEIRFKVHCYDKDNDN